MKPEQLELYEALLTVSQSLADYYAELCTLQEIYVQEVLAASRDSTDEHYNECTARLLVVRDRLREIEREAIKYKND